MFGFDSLNINVIGSVMFKRLLMWYRLALCNDNGIKLGIKDHTSLIPCSQIFNLLLYYFKHKVQSKKQNSNYV
jgi:hypothetical protein